MDSDCEWNHEEKTKNPQPNATFKFVKNAAQSSWKDIKSWYTWNGTISEEACLLWISTQCSKTDKPSMLSTYAVRKKKKVKKSISKKAMHLNSNELYLETTYSDSRVFGLDT